MQDQLAALNWHLLRHVPDFPGLWGPWCSMSTRAQERKNGQLTTLVIVISITVTLVTEYLPSCVNAYQTLSRGS